MKKAIGISLILVFFLSPLAFSAGEIDLNTATIKELTKLPGIGEVLAVRIVEYREANGGFKSTEELQKVNGIGRKTFEKFKDLINVTPPNTRDY